VSEFMVCTECEEEAIIDDGLDDDGLCHACAHALAHGRTSAMVSAHDLTIRDLREELRAERARTDALVAALPKCDTHPDRPATKAVKRGGGRWCDDCGPLDADYPRAAPLRAIQVARAKDGR
jgi:hypothetical protein